jgi:predicted transcriptional regulator
MVENVELASIDLRYETYRIRNKRDEARLFDSIAQRGIEKPLEGVDTAQGRFLLNGFKRFRCAKKLLVDCVPYVSMGQDEVLGIVDLLRSSNDRTLVILEQARFIDDLLSTHHMSLAEVAERLSRSKSWVSMRQGILKEMTKTVQQQLLDGTFPVYSYMYTLRPFMRMNKVSKEEIDQFVQATSGKNWSVREIDRLARGYFQGPSSLREAIDQGKVGFALDQMNQVPENQEGCSSFERTMLSDLEIAQKYMDRVMAKSLDKRLRARAFHAQANLLTAGLLSKAPAFLKILREFHDRTGQA